MTAATESVVASRIRTLDAIEAVADRAYRASEVIAAPAEVSEAPT